MAEPVNVINPEGALVSIPFDQVADATQEGYRLASPAEITDFSNKQKYGEGFSNELKAFGAGAARGATFGASDIAIPKLGISSQEALKQFAIQNPLATGAGELTGVGASLIAAPEASPAGLVARTGEAVTEAVPRFLANPEASSTVAKVLAGTNELGARALGSAVEGSAYGLGNSVSEHALGDPDVHGENLLHNIGYGALFGGALGGALGLKGAFSKDIEKAALKDAIIENAASHPPSSLTEIGERVQAGREMGLSTELTAKPELLKAEQILAKDSQFPAHSLQIQSLESPENRAFYKTFMESGTPEAKDAADYEAIQKQEGVKLTKKFVQDIAPEETLTDDAVAGGNKLVNAFSDQYKAEKKELEPFFKEFDNKALNVVDNPQDILMKVHEAIPDVAEYMMKTPKGYEIAKYKKSMPFSENTYGAMKDLVDVLNEPAVTIRDLRNLRESMRDRVNFLSAPRDSAQISSLRKSLMDLIQEKVQEIAPDMKVRDAFKKYAINEQNREVMERIFGGSISDKASFAKEIKPEDVLNKLFSNTVSVRAAKDILGPEFDKAAGNYLSQQIERVTDAAKNGFSSNKFGTFLRQKGPELEEALTQHPEILEKLRAITDKMRILPDSPAINPSGTAKTLGIMSKLQKLGGYLTPGGLAKLPGEMLKGISERFEQSQQRDLIDRILSSKQELGNDAQLINKRQQYGALTQIERMGQNMTNTIKRKVGSVFKTGSSVAEDTAKSVGAQELSAEEQQKKYAKTEKQIKSLTENFDNAVEHYTNSVKDLQDTAPAISNSLIATANRATQFLASKLPAQEPSSPMTPPYKPSPAELYKFNRYTQIVDNPLVALDQVKHGTLTRETLETLDAVYPKLFAEMKMQVMDKITKKLDSVPYRTKLMLSMFTGQDLSNSLKSQNIASAQMPNPAPPQQNEVKSTSKALSKITQSNQLLTASQASNQRKEV